MNNRFKFRVWDNLNKRYEKDMHHVRADGVICYEDGHPYCNGEHQDDFTIEQCTGLTDFHDKLIYENDVVNVYNPYEDKHRKCVVKYVIDGNTAQWLAVYLDGKRNHCSMGVVHDITGEYLDGNHCKIIGNIHEEEAAE